MSQWHKIASAPMDGTRVRVAHHLDPSSQRIESIMPVYGTFENGTWHCNAGFVCIDSMLRFEPTLWLPGATS